MSKIEQDAVTRCELAMMGMTQVVKSNDEVQFMFDYIKQCLGYEVQYNDIDVVKDRICKYSKNKVKYIDTYRLFGMPCIAFLLECDSEDEEEQYPAPFEESYGTPYKCSFCYVFNLADDMMCSEFGDVFFSKKSDGFYHVVH